MLARAVAQVVRVQVQVQVQVWVLKLAAVALTAPWPVAEACAPLPGRPQRMRPQIRRAPFSLPMAASMKTKTQTRCVP